MELLPKLRLNDDVILFNVLVVPEYTDFDKMIKSSGDWSSKLSEIKAKSSPSPYDDIGGPSRREGGVHQPGLDGILVVRESDE
ncbi:hypothetical protein Tco_0907516 [Tanacetum coccineum]|uniref:Uncharacterized protein n=1 Tax=Tanacetum coccineum TaxID=301880 RepID=A0ABQ5CMX9_9ASTR